MKTAGATLRDHLRAQFDATAVYPSRPYENEPHYDSTSVERLRRLDPQRRSSIRLFVGHFPYMAVEFVDRPVTTLTVLRDPVERTISMLKHLRIWVPGKRDCSLEEIYDDPWLQAWYLRNGQVKIFAFRPDEFDHDVNDQTYMHAIDIDDARLELAKANVERVDLLGFTDRFDEFLDRIERRFGWRFERSHRRNVSGRGGAVDQGLLRRIQRDLEADIDFYRHARSLAARRATG
jgi:hypothetical protein